MKQRWLPIVILTLFLVGSFYKAGAQSFCAGNINFEAGNLSGWQFDTALNAGAGVITSLTNTGALSNRHVLTSGTGTDYYGGFPVVDPQGGTHSLKLGNDQVRRQVDRATYTFTIPNNVTNYSIVYRYAVVFEDPVHTSSDQPYFKVRVYNAATGANINCASFTFVSQSGLNGFSTSSHLGQYGNATVYYKPWATASLNLSGQAGNTLVLEFTAADCALGAHMGYGYVDVLCPVFNISGTSCNPTTSLTAPAGFQYYTWYNANYTTVLGATQSVTLPTPTTLTNYHIVVTPFAGTGCQDTLLAQLQGTSISVNAGADTSVCNNQSIVLSPTVTANTPPLTYSWAPAAGLSCTSCLNPIASPAVNTNYILTVTDSLGCTRSDTVNVKAKVTLAAAATNALCFGAATGTAIASAALSTSPYTYSWNTVPAQTGATATGLAAGTYTVTATDFRGCNATQSVTVGQPTKVTASIASIDSVSCFGGSNGQATAIASGGTSPYSYSWNTIPLQTTAAATGLSAGTYVVTVTDANNCTDTESVAVRQPLVLNASVTKTNVSCYGGSNATAQVNVTGGNAPYTYAWSGLGAITSSLATGLSAGSYSVTITDHKGCITTLAFTISQPAPLTATTSGTAPVCYNGANGTATAVAAGGTTPYAYGWNTTPPQTTQTAQLLSAGSYTVLITDSAGCTLTATANVPQQLPIGVSAAATSTSCFGSSDGSATATAINGNGPYTYSWNTVPVQTGAIATGLGSGTYTITATSADGCTGTWQIYIGEPAKLLVTTLPKATCPGFMQGSMNAIATGGTAPYNYTWNTIPQQTAPIATGLGIGVYMVHVTDSKGCTDTSSATVGKFSAPKITATGDSVVCRGSSATLTAAGALSFAWSPAAYVSCATCPSTQAYPDSTKLYTVSGTDSNGCKDTTTIRVAVVQHVPISIDPMRTVCPGDTVRLGVTGGKAWSWIPASSVDNSHSSHPLATLQQQSTVYTVVVTENECFRDTLEQTVTIEPLPTIDLGPDIEAVTGGVVTLNAQTTNATSITWTPHTGLSCTDCYTPQFTMAGMVTYIAIVANRLGCKGTDTITISPVCDPRYFFFANVFTPNSDGHNDRFYPQAPANSLIRHFMIYNRWGEIVFSAANIMANDENAGWDGTWKGQALKPDVYVYVLDTICEDGGNIVTRGDVTLVR